MIMRLISHGRRCAAAHHTPVCGRRQRWWQQLRALADLAPLFDRAPPQDETANEGRAKQGPLAVPFSISSRVQATEEFERWRNSQGSLMFDSSAIKTVAIKPVFLPFFAFDGSLQATFTGKLGYTTRETYTDKDGKQHSTRRTDWYSKNGMRVGPLRLDPTVHVEMLQYAGFVYRREFVHQAITLDFTSQLYTARPLHAGMLPDSAGVHQFEAKPSFAYAAASSSFLAIAEKMALSKLKHPALDEVFQSSSLFGWSWSTACPATDWKQPDLYEVESLKPVFKAAQLFPRAGVVLVPFWICEYDLHGKNYRAFMNGATGKTVGATHIDQHKVQAASVAGATGISLACGFFVAQESANELLAVLIALAGPVVGWFGGARYGRQSVALWDTAGEKRAVLRQQNDAWAPDPFWQSELRKFASAWESQEEERRANARSSKHAATQRLQEDQRRVAAETAAAIPKKPEGAGGTTTLTEASSAATRGDERASEGSSNSTPAIVDETTGVTEYEWRRMDDYAILGLDREDFEGSGLSQTMIAQRMRKAEIEAAHRAQCLVWEPRYNEKADPAECVERLERIDEAKENLVGDKAAQEARKARRDERRARRIETDSQY